MVCCCCVKCPSKIETDRPEFEGGWQDFIANFPVKYGEGSHVKAWFWDIDLGSSGLPGPCGIPTDRIDSVDFNLFSVKHGKVVAISIHPEQTECLAIAKWMRQHSAPGG